MKKKGGEQEQKNNTIRTGYNKTESSKEIGYVEFARRSLANQTKETNITEYPDVETGAEMASRRAEKLMQEYNASKSSNEPGRYQIADMDYLVDQAEYNPWMRDRYANHFDCLPRVRQTDPNLDFRTCPGYQRPLQKGETQMPTGLSNQEPEHNPNVIEYSYGNEELDLPELEDTVTVTAEKEQNGQPQTEPQLQTGQQTQTGPETTATTKSDQVDTSDPQEQPQKRRIIGEPGTINNPDTKQPSFVVVTKQYGTARRQSTQYHR